MASGLLGKAALVATTYTSIYTVPAGKTATANIRVINRGLVDAVPLRLAICPAGYVNGAMPGLADYIEPVDVPVPGSGVLEDTGMVMSAGEVLVAYAATAGLTVRAYGFEA